MGSQLVLIYLIIQRYCSGEDGNFVIQECQKF